MVLPMKYFHKDIYIIYIYIYIYIYVIYICVHYMHGIYILYIWYMYTYMQYMLIWIVMYKLFILYIYICIYIYIYIYIYIILTISRLSNGFWTMSKIETSALARPSPSEVYPAGTLQWHFTCAFDFRHSQRLLFAARLSVLTGLIMHVL